MCRSAILESVSPNPFIVTAHAASELPQSYYPLVLRLGNSYGEPHQQAPCKSACVYHSSREWSRATWWLPLISSRAQPLSTHALPKPSWLLIHPTTHTTANFALKGDQTSSLTSLCFLLFHWIASCAKRPILSRPDYFLSLNQGHFLWTP